MFHKALWMRNYKQGKWAMIAIWLITLFFLPFSYYQSAVDQEYMQKNWGVLFGGDGPYYYSYSFYTGEFIILQIAALLFLSASLIGWERSSGSIDFLFSLPFQRKDIFLAKWLFGFFNITALHAVCYGLMYWIKKTTIHDQYQDFTHFSKYFLVSYLVLTGVYTFCLFIGTIAGSVVSQAILGSIFLLLPFGLYTLISGVVLIHTEGYGLRYDETIRKLMIAASLPLQLEGINIQYDFHPDSKRQYMHMHSLYMLLTPVLYTIGSLWLGVKLYIKTPNEANGKILLFQALSKIFVPCVIVCCSLLGGLLFSDPSSSSSSLISFYIAAIIAGSITYIIMKRFINSKLAWNGKQ